MSPIGPSPQEELIKYNSIWTVPSGPSIYTEGSLNSPLITFPRPDIWILFAGTRVILEFIPNHTSNESDWFTKSVQREPGFEDFYVWMNASEYKNGEPMLPNDWVSEI